MSLDVFLSRLQKVRKSGKSSWMACCPAHGDNNPSMAVSVGSDGRVLVHCFSHQCSIDEITGAVGMEIKDLMPENIGFHRIKPLRMGVNPRDALISSKTDLYGALVIAKMVQAGNALTEANTLYLAQIIGRLQLTIDLAGGE